MYSTRIFNIAPFKSFFIFSIYISKSVINTVQCPPWQSICYKLNKFLSLCHTSYVELFTILHTKKWVHIFGVPIMNLCIKSLLIKKKDIMIIIKHTSQNAFQLFLIISSSLGENTPFLIGP